MAKEKYENNSVETVKASHKGGFFQTILFQNMAVNILILVTVLIVIFVMIDGMKYIMTIAEEASTNQADTLIAEGKLRQCTLAIDGSLSALLGAATMESIDSETLQGYADTMKNAEAQIPEHLEYLSTSLMVTQIEGGADQYAAMESAINAYLADANAIMEACLSRNLEPAFAVLQATYYPNMNAMNASFDAAEEGIVSLSEGLGAYKRGNYWYCNHCPGNSCRSCSQYSQDQPQDQCYFRRSCFDHRQYQ